jgi:hypothetical protein
MPGLRPDEGGGWRSGLWLRLVQMDILDAFRAAHGIYSVHAVLCEDKTSSSDNPIACLIVHVVHEVHAQQQRASKMPRPSDEVSDGSKLLRSTRRLSELLFAASPLSISTSHAETQ